VQSGARQGIAGVWRTLERQRGQKQLGLEEIAQRKAALEEEVAKLEGEVAGLREMKDYVDREADRINVEADAIEERASERRELLESHHGLVTLLKQAGEARVERALVEIGWVEPEEPGDAP
jgi:hypothetical protein